jgi:hypothetical protein
MRVIFGDKAPYGKHLEIGTKNMAARPHLVTTASQKRRDNFRTIADSTGKEIHRK